MSSNRPDRGEREGGAEEERAPARASAGEPGPERPPEDQITQVRVGSVWIEVDAEGRPVPSRQGSPTGRGLWRALLEALRRRSSRG